MRFLRLLLTLPLAAGCAGTLYTHLAGPANGTADEVYACVQSQLKTLGYTRTQYNESERWYVAKKSVRDPNSSGLYLGTNQILDTKVSTNDQGAATLDIKAHSFDRYSSARGDEQTERKATAGTEADAKTVGEACSK